MESILNIPCIHLTEKYGKRFLAGSAATGRLLLVLGEVTVGTQQNRQMMGSTSITDLKHTLASCTVKIAPCYGFAAKLCAMYVYERICFSWLHLRSKIK
jgi:hypothetical protein